MSEQANLYQRSVEVPSLGKFYGDKLPGGKVMLRAMTVREEKLLLAGTLQDALDKILTVCIVSSTIPIDEFLLTDKFYLLLHLRALSYGSEFDFQLECPACGNSFMYKLQLPEGLTLKIANDQDVEPFDITLPVSGKKVSLRFLRGKDEKNIEFYARQLKQEDGDPSYSYRMATHIVALDGKPVTVLEAKAFCEDMIGRDSMAFRTAIAERETGLDLSVKAVCPACRQEVLARMPMTRRFFPANVS